MKKNDKSSSLSSISSANDTKPRKNIDSINVNRWRDVSDILKQKGKLRITQIEECCKMFFIKWKWMTMNEFWLFMIDINLFN